MTERDRPEPREYFTNPLYVEPEFAGDIRNLSEEMGSVTQATAEIFRRANIEVRVDGSDTEWLHGSAGALYFGDHRNGMESLVLLAMWGQTGREDVHFIAKPFSVQAMLRASLGARAVGMTLPVIPRTLASDRENILNRDLAWRVLARNDLPTTEEIKGYNAQSLEKARGHLLDGHAVTIYPTGGIMKATETWQSGIGRIVASLPEEKREDIGIVPFQIQDFSKLRLLRALVLQSHGVTPRHQVINVRLGTQGSVAELLEESSLHDPRAVTEALRRRFFATFGDET